MIDEKEMEQYQQALASAQAQAGQERVQNMQQQSMMEKEDKTMIQDQLDLGEELERLDYLLRGYTLERDDETGAVKWVKPKNTEMMILSDYGVHLIRNTIAWYINKNTLLSNYDEETIRHKMEDFSNDLNDTIFMEYEKIFQYPTVQDCEDVLDKRIENKKDLRLYALKIMGKKHDEETGNEIKKELIDEMENIIEKELNKIKEQIIKNKLKRFMLLIRSIQDSVHSTYNRAYMGMERKSLREHMHVSETKGGFGFQPQQSKGFLDLFKKR